jgi:hypothetical protein
MGVIKVSSLLPLEQLCLGLLDPHLEQLWSTLGKTDQNPEAALASQLKVPWAIP